MRHQVGPDRSIDFSFDNQTAFYVLSCVTCQNFLTLSRQHQSDVFLKQQYSFNSKNTFRGEMYAPFAEQVPDSAMTSCINDEQQLILIQAWSSTYL